jgi:predicted lipoprotein with Yx(FWY)xxD motif
VTVTVRGTVVRRTAVLPVLVVALAALAACGGGPDEGPKPQLSGSDTTLEVRPSFYGAILADGAGHALYQFDGDKFGVSNCTEGCAEVFRPYIAVGEPRSADANKNALNDDQITTITRTDGRQQVAYAGHPLYYFANDAPPGDPVHAKDVAGAGQKQFGGTWSAVSAAGDPVASNGSTVVPY